MLKIAITGSDGFLGFHLQAHILSQGFENIIPINRTTLNTPPALQEALAGVDVIFHLAAVHRWTKEQAQTHQYVNQELAQNIVNACENLNISPAIIYTNTIHQDNADSPYGASKHEASEILRIHCKTHDAAFTNAVLPNLYGEYGRPHNNSVVATFSHQIAHGEQPVIHGDPTIRFLHVSDACKSLIHCLDNTDTYTEHRIDPTSDPLSVSQLKERLETMEQMHQTYVNEGIIPQFKTQEDLHFFNCLRAAIFPGHYPIYPQLYTDDRGSLAEMVKSHHGGQCFFSTTKPGITRGNHFHFHKVERFAVIAGEAEITLRKLFSDEIHTFRVSGDKPCYIDIPPLYTHAITNVGDSILTTLFWSHEIFTPDNADTYAHDVMPENLKFNDQQQLAETA